MVSPQNRKEMENTRVSSERSGLKSFFIEIVGKDVLSGCFLPKLDC